MKYILHASMDNIVHQIEDDFDSEEEAYEAAHDIALATYQDYCDKENTLGGVAQAMFGKPLIELPDKQQSVVFQEFEERAEGAIEYWCEEAE